MGPHFVVWASFLGTMDFFSNSGNITDKLKGEGVVSAKLG